MKSHQDCLDFLPLNCSNFGWLKTPPCNAAIAFVIGTIGSIAGAAIQYSSAQDAAKQAELNAEAQNKAIGQERLRQAQQNEENQRRAATEQARFRAQQQAAMASSGAMMGTGSSLSIEADTWAKQQTELSDQQYMADMSQRQLTYEGQSIMAMGQQQASAIRSQASGQLLSNVGGIASSTYQGYTTRPQKVPSPTSKTTGPPAPRIF